MIIHLPQSDDTIRVRGAHTGKAMSVVEQTLPARRLIAPHTHQTDVWVYVLTNQVGVLVGDEVAIGGPGDWLLKPRDITHAMFNPTDEPSRLMEILTPGGYEGFFEDVGTTDESFEQVCERYGLHFETDSPWTARLREQFGLL